MKAIDYYNRLKEAKSDKEFETVLASCLDDLVYDANKLIKVRKAKSDDAVSKCILEVNDKWIAILNLRDKDKNIDPESPLWGTTLYRDGFKAAYVEINPKHKWFFDVKKHQTRMEEERRIQNYKNADESIEFWKNQNLDITNPTLILYGLTPYTEFENTEFDGGKIISNVLKALYILGSNSGSMNNFVTIAYMKIIAKYIHVLRAWQALKKIDMSFINMNFNEIDEAVVKAVSKSV